MRPPRLGPLLLALAVASLTTACEDDDGGTEPQIGTLMVGNSSFGAGTDADGYVVTIDGQAQTPRATLNVGQYWDLPPGSYAVALSDLAPNCATDTNNGASTGPNPQTATVLHGDTALVWFAVVRD